MLNNSHNSAQILPVLNSSHANLGNTGDGSQEKPHIVIVEQPASKALRFRYECEGRSAGSIPGVNSTPENKTFPAIKLVGFKGNAVIVVSCVTKDEPYRAHPHNLVGKEGCKDGIHTMEIKDENMTAVFPNLGIQCVKKKDIEEALKIREHKRVDPFKHGFDHKNQPSAIDLNAVRLCFQAFLRDPQKKIVYVPPAVVSDPIYDKKAMSDLVITKLSHSSAPAKGGQEMILLCEKVAKEDIQVYFYEEHNGIVVWEGYGEFTAGQVHKQVAICFKTPHYSRHIEAGHKAKVFIQLKRQSDGAVSEPLQFHFTPEDIPAKRRKITNEESRLDEFVRQYPRKCSVSPQQILDYGIVKTESVSPSYDQNYLNSPPRSSQASPCPYPQVPSPNPHQNLYQSPLPPVKTENQPLPSFNHLPPRACRDYRMPLIPSDPSSNIIGGGPIFGSSVAEVPDNQARNPSPSNAIMITAGAGNGGSSGFMYQVNIMNNVPTATSYLNKDDEMAGGGGQATAGTYYLENPNEILHRGLTRNQPNALMMATSHSYLNGVGSGQPSANQMMYMNQASASSGCHLTKNDPGTSLDNIDKEDLVQEEETILSENLTSMSITEPSADSLLRIVNEAVENFQCPGQMSNNLG